MAIDKNVARQVIRALEDLGEALIDILNIDYSTSGIDIIDINDYLVPDGLDPEINIDNIFPMSIDEWLFELDEYIHELKLILLGEE